MINYVYRYGYGREYGVTRLRLWMQRESKSPTNKIFKTFTSYKTKIFKMEPYLFLCQLHRTLPTKNSAKCHFRPPSF